jgi:hypothetical protein
MTPLEMATQGAIASVYAAPNDNEAVAFVGDCRCGANGDDSVFGLENGALGAVGRNCCTSTAWQEQEIRKVMEMCFAEE